MAAAKMPLTLQRGKPDALPSCAQKRAQIANLGKATVMGASNYHYFSKVWWWVMQGSNLRPAD